MRERLGLSDEQFAEFFRTLAARLGRRTFSPEAYAHAIGYPWSRPARSYLFTGGTVQLLDELQPRRRAEILLRFTGIAEHRPDTARTPLLAFGSNASPAALRRKFAHFPDAEDRSVLVLAGRLHEFDVGASAQPTIYGAMPATLFASPGTAVRAGVLWVTPHQFTQLVWSELSYGLGRLDAPFEADEPDHSLGSVIAFVSRFGAFAPSGRPIALAAIPASGRRAPALAQEQVLGAAAALALGPDAGAEALVREVFESFSELIPRLERTVRRCAEPFSSPRWTPYRSGGDCAGLGSRPEPSH
ncbi:MAG: hypothetical protein M3Z06_13105 [Actinomycetota bacterium]|nr:hypothetical protein [Actinomycetota bacterium]